MFCRACAGIAEPSEEERIGRLTVVDAETVPRVGFGTRLTAGAVDWVILLGAGLVLALVFLLVGRALPAIAGVLGRVPIGSWIFWLALCVFVAGYFILLTAAGGQTPGKQAMGIAVVREDGTAPHLRDAVVAFAGSVVSLAVFGRGYWVILADPGRRAWHDRWARTLVVSLDPPAG